MTVASHFRKLTLVLIAGALVWLVVPFAGRGWQLFIATGHAAANSSRHHPAAASAEPALAGGDIAPCREIRDVYPEFSAISVDPQNGRVAMSDPQTDSVLIYDLNAGSANPTDVTEPLARLKGPATSISHTAGVTLDPVDRRIYVSDNDIGQEIGWFPYGANGNYPVKSLAMPITVGAIGISHKHNQIATPNEYNAAILVYRLGATGVEPPLREIRGERTMLADPHGLYWDDQHNEIATTNFGNWNRGMWDEDYNGGGHYDPPSILFFAANAKGNAKPVRSIQGDKTQLNWPFGISRDTKRDEIAVANYAGHSVLIFKRDADGNVAPIRAISGPHTGVELPIGVAFDSLHNELWVANNGHTALVFDSDANGDVAPKRIILNAPPGTPSVHFALTESLTYDTKRQQLLVGS